MRPLLGACPALSKILDDLSENELRELVTRLIGQTAHEFEKFPEFEKYSFLLGTGGSLNAEDSKRLHDMHKAFEQRELEIEDSGGPEEEIKKYFKLGRYAWTLFSATQEIDAPQADNLLHDMGHAFNDPEMFWEDALREAQALADKRS